LFSRHEWIQLLSDVGFEPHMVPADYEEGVETFVGLKASGV